MFFLLRPLPNLITKAFKEVKATAFSHTNDTLSINLVCSIISESVSVEHRYRSCVFCVLVCVWVGSQAYVVQLIIHCVKFCCLLILFISALAGFFSFSYSFFSVCDIHFEPMWFAVLCGFSLSHAVDWLVGRRNRFVSTLRCTIPFVRHTATL